MDMNELTGYGIPPALITRWREWRGEQLLPLQELAIRNGSLFGTENMLVQAPTSSGKTFIGEMAAVHAALQGRKAAYLLPIKALAEEKYQEFCEQYSSYGLRIIVCTRDRRCFDRAFEYGEFDIAIAVYEKLDRLAALHPERLRELAVIVADEIEVVSDPDRGAAVELLLTRAMREGVRIIGLSAVLGVPEHPAAWLNAHLIEYDRRPRELRYGVLFEGQFRYCGHNDPREGEENLESAHSATPWAEVMQNACALAEAGEPCLIFVKARSEAWRGAELLARQMNLPTAGNTIEVLRVCPPTRVRDLLLRTCETGVAFHSADLLPNERHIVEEGFRTGEIRVLVATNTLATGMNLPARNVFLTSEKWVFDPYLDAPWRSPITRSEFENISGRAGRYGVGEAHGRAILVAATPFDRDALWRRYIKGQREPVQPQLARGPFEEAMVRLVASRCCHTIDEVTAFFMSTLSARMVWEGRHSGEEVQFRLAAALRRCAEEGALRAIAKDDTVVPVDPETPLHGLRFEVTSWGRVLAAKGVSIMSARAIRHWLRLSESRDWQILDLLVALAVLPDAQLRQVALTRQEYESGIWFTKIKKVTETWEWRVDTPLNRFRNCRLMPFYNEVRALKAALFLERWIEEVALHVLEAEYDVTAGQIRGAADQLAWLADATAALADADECAPGFVTTLYSVAERLHYGLREQTLSLARIVPEAPRHALLALAELGVISPQSVRTVPQALLGRWLDPDQVNRLKHWAENARPEDVSTSEDKTSDMRPALVVDERRPGMVLVNGISVSLQDKQYRLLRALARRPGECVGYEDLYRQVWGDIIVEDNQMHYQKRMLIKRLSEADPTLTELIETVPKYGFILKLNPEQVRFTEVVPAVVG